MRTFPEELWFGFLLLISVCATVVILCATLASLLTPASLRLPRKRAHWPVTRSVGRA